MVKKQPKLAMRRTTRNALIAAVFFVLVPGLIVLDHRFGDCFRHCIQRAGYADGDRKTYHGKAFAVMDVIDGDTIDIDFPDGELPYTRVRLLGVDTPETKNLVTGIMHFGPEAAAFTSTLTLGKQVTLFLDTVGDCRGRYGRLLAYVQLPDGNSLNERLIKQGYGYAYLRYPHTQFDQYSKLMQNAIKNKTGLWQNASRDDLPAWLQKERPDLLRYP